MKLPIQHRVLVNGEYWDFGRPVLDACQIGDKVIIIFDFMSYPRNSQARNMVAFDLKKNEIWTAEHPTNQVSDTYIKFVSEKPLTACNFASFECRIDPENGRLVDAQFT